MANRFIQFFENSIKENWDLPAMISYETKQSYKYKDVAREIAKLHILFKELDVQQNEKIALIGDNTPEWAIVFLATITYGAVVVPILQTFSNEDVVQILEHSESKFLFVDGEQLQRLNIISLKSVRAVFALEDSSCRWQNENETIHLIVRNLPSIFKAKYPTSFGKEDVEFGRKDDSEMCVLNYTSGTTGNSKAVMLSGENFFCLLNFGKSNKIGDKNKTFLCYIPLSHIFGYGDGIFFPILSGSNVVYLRRFSNPTAFLNIVQDVKPNNVSMVPLVLNAICKEEVIPMLENCKNNPKLCSQLRKKMIDRFGGNIDQMVVGGASMDKEVEQALSIIKFPYTLAYGMTECASLVSQESEQKGNGSVGKIIEGVSVKIDSVDPCNIPGEILVKGKNVMIGYFKNELATKAAFKEGWFKTGDLGVMDKEGCLYIKGRCKVMILSSSGQNIYPEDIELKINALQWVSECLVVTRNNKLIALIQPNEEYFKIGVENQKKFLFDQRLQINKRLATYEYITEFFIQQHGFEKTGKGSIKRYLYE